MMKSNNKLFCPFVMKKILKNSAIHDFEVIIVKNVIKI